MELERSFGESPARAQPFGEPAHVRVRRHAGSHALLAFEYLLRTRKAVARNVRSHQAVRRGFRGMQLLRIGCVTQELPETGRHGARRSQAILRLFHVEFQNVRHTRSCGQLPRGAGRMEYAVMRAAEEFTDAHA